MKICSSHKTKTKAIQYVQYCLRFRYEKDTANTYSEETEPMATDTETILIHSYSYICKTQLDELDLFVTVFLSLVCVILSPFHMYSNINDSNIVIVHAFSIARLTFAIRSPGNSSFFHRLRLLFLGNLLLLGLFRH